MSELSRSYPAVAAITRGQAVKFSGAGVTPCGVGEAACGIALDSGAIGESIGVCHTGGCWAQAGAAFALGAKLQTDASARLITATSGNPIVANALEAGPALASGVPGLVWVRVDSSNALLA